MRNDDYREFLVVIASTALLLAAVLIVMELLRGD